MSRLLCFALLAAAMPTSGAWARTPELRQGAAVRFQASEASELGPGWHAGTVFITPTGCTMIAKPDPRVPGGRRVLALLFMQTLERRDGARWIDVPVKPLMKKEPKHCQEGTGG